MKWNILVNRDRDFLKNCLLYESFVENYKQTWGIPHPPFLTDREGNTFTHYISFEAHTNLDNELIKHIGKKKIIKKMETEGVKRFNRLIDFCKKNRNYKQFSKQQLLKTIKEYFYLYKKAYPHFQIIVNFTYCKKIAKTLSEEEGLRLAKFRYFGRSSFEKAHEYSEPLFREIGRRFNQSVQEIKFLTPGEICDLLDNKEVDIDKKIKDRQKCFFVHLNGRFILVDNANIVFKSEEMTELKGNVAFKGKYTGIVRVVISIEDMKGFKEGEVLVVRETVPEFVTLGINKAGAIVTNEGGITCHAAIISRELKIPCIVGTKNATKMLKNGDEVEVDAIKGIVNILKQSPR
ncbi:MAG: PEP-utilizing enzyme [archaeon]